MFSSNCYISFFLFLKNLNHFSVGNCPRSCDKTLYNSHQHLPTPVLEKLFVFITKLCLTGKYEMISLNMQRALARYELKVKLETSVSFLRHRKIRARLSMMKISPIFCSLHEFHISKSTEILKKLKEVVQLTSEFLGSNFKAFLFVRFHGFPKRKPSSMLCPAAGR